MLPYLQFSGEFSRVRSSNNADTDKEESMKSCRVVLAMFGTLCALAFATVTAHSQEKAAPGGVQVHMVITDEAVHEDSEAPSLQPGDVKVKQGKTFLNVTN
jgi:hypothetical protein